MSHAGEEEWFNKASEYLRLNKFAEAEACYKNILKVDPQNYFACLNLAHTYDRQSLTDDALKIIDRVIEMDPLKPVGWSRRASLLLNLNFINEALECTNIALALDPKNTDAMGCKGYALEIQRREKEALECYEKAIELGGNCWGAKGQLLAALFEYEEALKCLEKAGVSSVAALSCQGLCHIGREEYDQAIERYDKILEVYPRDPLILCNKATVCIIQHKLEEAKKCLNRFGPTDVGYLQPWFGFVALNERRYKEAEHYFKKAPTNDVLAYSLGILGLLLVDYVTHKSENFPEVPPSCQQQLSLLSQCTLILMSATTLFHLGFYRETKKSLLKIPQISEKCRAGTTLLKKLNDSEGGLCCVVCDKTYQAASSEV